MILTTDRELLATLSEAGKKANNIWATNQVNEALEHIRRVLPYNPDLPPEIAQWLMRTWPH